ncbi:hypothetical protein Rhe02_77840 [Rhizocola hellebori]|uniref:Uncharacterized protein n=1 Tax=Rhizocola hellebori TaxID=1392758 RepID=A0A8J3VKN4_9ACTN|nr:hypothetical protein [Rhizocola hellebori]GIH09717.1 hypothetical protein Rhe02_77840 [Rhizocola hellebori]
MADDFEARLQEVLRQLESRLQRLSSERSRLDGASSEVLSAIGDVAPASITTQIRTTNASIGQAVAEATKTVQEWIQQAFAVLLMRRYVEGWREVGGKATVVSRELHPDILESDTKWEGIGAREYFQTVSLQSTSAARIGEVGTKTADALEQSSALMLSFYVAILPMVVKIIIAIVQALVALGSVIVAAAAALRAGVRGVLLWPIVGMLVWQALTALGNALRVTLSNTAQMRTAGLALLASLVAQWSWVGSLQVQLRTAFPNMRWPEATTGRFDDSAAGSGWSVIPPPRR